MEKQMIEEMAQCKNFNGYTCKSCGVKNSCDRYILAEELYNAGYRKIPENAVVLTREEQQRYAAYKIIEPQIRGCLDRERELEKRLDTIRKVTAEKFAERLKEKMDNQQYILLPTATVKYMIDEICKEITEGKV